MGQFKKVWIQLRSSLWFLPALMVAGSIVLAVTAVELDASSLNLKLSERWPRLFGVTSDGARSILVTISSSIITVAGVVFSITIVALSLASNQYTPRILRTFMRDRGTQCVLGVFVAAFIYSLLVMRTVRAGDEPFVPAVSIALAILLALVCMGFLVYFIHHIAAMMQAPTVIAAISEETVESIQNTFPASDSGDISPHAHVDGGVWTEIRSRKTGYIQAFTSRLQELATKDDLVIRVERRIGEFVIEGAPLLSARSGGGWSDRLERQLLGCIAIDSFRTVEQDPGYGIRQLVDIAQKALSPGVNDTSTAVNCIDYLGAILHILVQRVQMPAHVFVGGRVRLIFARPLTVQRLIDQGMLQIRQSAFGNPAVILRMLKVIGQLQAVSRSEYVRTLERHVRLLEEITAISVKSDFDRASIQGRIRSLRSGSGRQRCRD